MNEALKILESNELIRHIVLFKLYIESQGEAMKQIYGLKKSIKELYGNDFNDHIYNQNVRYLSVNKGYIGNNASHLTYKGLEYLEGWLKSFEKLTEDETEKLNKELPQQIFDFFKFTKETTTVLSFVNQMLKLAERF
ncbi:hypothetical protein KO494_01770 [Lacinutrix sp. C3R15]|uniref:hypothetical protein n=1 Tax=Flavobacteriaceae TaxID=49546 RepID=UPI001C09C4BC|nr:MULTISPECIES: hypothetical protein [Flavobacteriaceae]MBU2938257.1 hypothetical protein [Lacinutrix sp. C3R15]MDO6621571.1 hypothetical protein [Oceanihabitans sp. 1_MG-2023]